MAITVTANLTTLSLCESTTGWSGGSTDSTMVIQGTYSLAEQIKATTGAIRTYTIGSNTDFTGKMLYVWMCCNGLCDSKANGGFRVYLEDSSSNSGLWYVGGGLDNLGWNCFCVDPSTIPTYYNGSLNTGNSTINYASITKVGVQFKTLTSVIGTAKNVFWDAVRYGSGLTITSGTTDGITLEDIYTVDSTSTNSYGVIQKKHGVYIIQGKLVFGSSSSGSIDFNDTGQVCIFPQNYDSRSNTFVGSGKNGFQILGNSGGTTNFEFTGSFVKANGQSFVFDANDGYIDLLDVSGDTFTNALLIEFAAGQTINHTVFDDVDQVDPATSDFAYNTLKNSVGTSGALLWPSDDSNVSDLIFLDCDYCIEYDSSSDSTDPSFVNIVFDDAGYDVNNTSGSAVSIYNLGTSNANSYTGSTVTFIANPVTTLITVKDISTGLAIEGARVLVWPTSSAAGFPYQASVSITSSGTTVTVTHASHGLITGDNVIISGANEDPYNGAYPITYINTDSYSYTMTETATSPATGTITSTFAFINTTTDSDGEVSDIRVVSTNQPIAGWVRKASSSPYYQSGAIAGTVSSSNGFETTIQLVSDE